MLSGESSVPFFSFSSNSPLLPLWVQPGSFFYEPQVEQEGTLPLQLFTEPGRRLQQVPQPCRPDPTDWPRFSQEPKPSVGSSTPGLAQAEDSP